MCYFVTKSFISHIQICYLFLGLSFFSFYFTCFSMKIVCVSISFLRVSLAASQHFYVEHFSLLLFSKYSLIISFSSFCFRKWLHSTVKSIDKPARSWLSLRHSWACLGISSLSWCWFTAVTGILPSLRAPWPLPLKNRKINWASPGLPAVCLWGYTAFVGKWVLSCF